MLRSSVTPRKSGFRHTGDAFRNQLFWGDPAAGRGGLHAPVHLRDLQPGSTLARVGALPVAAYRAQLFGGCTEVRVLDRYTWQFAGRLGLGYRLALGKCAGPARMRWISTSRAGSSAASASSPQAPLLCPRGQIGAAHVTNR